MKTITDTRISVSQEEVAGISFERYYGSFIIQQKDGSSVTLTCNSPERFNNEVVSFVRCFKYQDPKQEHIDLLARIIEAATDAVRSLEDKMAEKVEA